MNNEQLLKHVEKLIQESKSTAEFYVPDSASPLMDDLQIGCIWTASIQPFNAGFNHLRITTRVVNRSLVEFSFLDPNSERLGLINMRRAV